MGSATLPDHETARSSQPRNLSPTRRAGELPGCSVGHGITYRCTEVSRIASSVVMPCPRLNDAASPGAVTCVRCLVVVVRREPFRAPCRGTSPRSRSGETRLAGTVRASGRRVLSPASMLSGVLCSAPAPADQISNAPEGGLFEAWLFLLTALLRLQRPKPRISSQLPQARSPTHAESA